MFKITIQKEHRELHEQDYFETIEERTAETRKEANKIKRELIKKYELKDTWYIFANFSTGFELAKNY